MNILVTGGAGFIGSALIRYLINETNNSVINVDKLTYAGNLSSLNNVAENSRYSFVRADVCDAEKMAGLFVTYQPDVVMHLAAESHVDRSISSSADFIQTNIIGTHVLLETSRLYWQTLPQERKRNFRFHHISTDEVYGDLGDTNELFRETTPYAPSSPYSASKASSDHLVRAWHRTYGLPILVTNCSNNYGPFQFPEKLIPRIIQNALAGKPLTVYGDGSQIRDWLYVDDHVRALYQVILKGAIGETYNIGGHNEKQNLEVIHTICSILDELIAEKPASINSFKELIIFVNDRPGHDKRYAIDASKIDKELGWTPAEQFTTGIRKTVEWYLNNQDWIEHIESGHYQVLAV